MSVSLHVLCVSDRYFLFTMFVPYRRELEQHGKGSPYGSQPNRVAANAHGDGDGDGDVDEDEDWMFRPNNQAMITLPVMAENRFSN